MPDRDPRVMTQAERDEEIAALDRRRAEIAAAPTSTSSGSVPPRPTVTPKSHSDMTKAERLAEAVKWGVPAKYA